MSKRFIKIENRFLCYLNIRETYWEKVRLTLVLKFQVRFAQHFKRLK